MNKPICLTCFFIIFFGFLPLPANTAEEVENQQDNSVIIFEGKLSCPLTRAVFMPFSGIFTDINISPGQFVTKGTTIAQYDLDENRAIQLGRETLFNEIDDLRHHREMDKQTLAELERQEQELLKLTEENLTPKHLLEKIQTKLRLRRAYLLILEKRLSFARDFSQRTLHRIRDLLGYESLTSGQIPEFVRLKAPISGVVLSLHPQLKKDSLLPDGTVVTTIGTMDTMLIRSLVYERDVVHMSPGDHVSFFPDSLPEIRFPATITSISWIPASLAPDRPSYYQVEMTVANDNLTLRAGFKGRVEHSPLQQ